MMILSIEVFYFSIINYFKILHLIYLSMFYYYQFINKIYVHKFQAKLSFLLYIFHHFLRHQFHSLNSHYTFRSSYSSEFWNLVIKNNSWLLNHQKTSIVNTCSWKNLFCKAAETCTYMCFPERTEIQPPQERLWWGFQSQ